MQPAAMFGQPGPQELLLVLLVILLLFGSSRLPGLARAIGRSLSEFKRGKEEAIDAVKEVVAEVDDSKGPRKNTQGRSA